MNPSLTLIILTLQLAAATFVPENVPGNYTLFLGTPSCANFITFTRDGTLLPPATISVDGVVCTGGILRLASPTDGDAFADIFLATSDVGDFLRGQFDQPLVCGDFEIDSAAEINFVSPTNDVTVNLDDIVGFDTAGAFGSNNTSFTLQKDTAYVTQGTDCVYTRSIDESEKESFDVLDTIGECFPGSATVLLQSGQRRRMRDVQIGDSVLVAPGVYSQVFAWTHRDDAAVSQEYVRIETEQQSLVVTGGHYVYVGGKTVAAAHVVPGDVMTDAQGRDVTVASVERAVDSVGLYNPQTIDGDIIVDGLRCTTYTKILKAVTAHSLLVPVRLWHKVMTLLRAATAADSLVY